VEFEDGDTQETRIPDKDVRVLPDKGGGSKKKDGASSKKPRTAGTALTISWQQRSVCVEHLSRGVRQIRREVRRYCKARAGASAEVMLMVPRSQTRRAMVCKRRLAAKGAACLVSLRLLVYFGSGA
jgi:hypothetical protein